MKQIEVIYKKPREGKTTELIKRCAKNGGVIVSANSMRARHTYEMAKSLGYEIPMPITHENLIDKYYDRINIKKIYIDDATELIQKIANGLEIGTIVIDDLSDIIEKQLTKGQDKSNEELKLCPFCSGQAIYMDKTTEPDRPNPTIECDDCDARMCSLTKEFVIEQWNKRTCNCRK